MNMQNIPSHADDIRHMFRATPRTKYTKECTEKDNIITVELPRYHIVKTSEGSKEVCHLEIGDKVCFKNGIDEHLLELKSIVENGVNDILSFNQFIS